MPERARIVEDRRVRWLFAIGAVWNISAAVMALALPDFHTASFFGDGAAIHGHIGLMNTQAFWVSVLLFGIGYAIVARDPSKNHGIVLLAAAGKTYVFGIWTVAWTRSEVTDLALVGGIGDLLFAAAFIWFLVRVRADS